MIPVLLLLWKNSSPPFTGVIHVIKIKITYLTLVLPLIGCSEKTSLHLIDNLYSYQTQHEVSQIINGIEFNGRTEGLLLGKVDYNHLDEEGKLVLKFYENQLVSVGFYPKDTTAYLMKLEELMNIIPGEVFRNFEGVMISKGYDYEMGGIGGLFIVWMDPNLREKYKNRIW